MQIIFSNAFGCHSKSELILSYPQLINVSIAEYDNALNSGWLLSVKNKQPMWYQCRSTRVRLTECNYKFHNEFSIFEEPYNTELLDDIYTKYCNHKHYKKYFEVGEFLPIDSVIGYYVDNELTAWTKLRRYNSNSIESVMFAWDYKYPDSHLGVNSLKAEVAWAKEMGHIYFYMGPGYEKNSIYKSDIDGFEWWTGSEWSRDIDQYIWLCKRDSRIASHHQIHTVLANLQHDHSIR